MFWALTTEKTFKKRKNLLFKFRPLHHHHHHHRPVKLRSVVDKIGKISFWFWFFPSCRWTGLKIQEHDCCHVKEHLKLETTSKKIWSLLFDSHGQTYDVDNKWLGRVKLVFYIFICLVCALSLSKRKSMASIFVEPVDLEYFIQVSSKLTKISFFERLPIWRI